MVFRNVMSKSLCCSNAPGRSQIKVCDPPSSWFRTVTEHFCSWRYLYCYQDKSTSDCVRIRRPVLPYWPSFLQDGTNGGGSPRTYRSSPNWGSRWDEESWCQVFVRPLADRRRTKGPAFRYGEYVPSVGWVERRSVESSWNPYSTKWSRDEWNHHLWIFGCLVFRRGMVPSSYPADFGLYHRL